MSSSTRLQGQILQLIHDRHFESGERLFSEREFAEKFATTRSAVREAFTALEALRVVERRPQSGIFLRDLSADSSIDALVLEVNAGLRVDSKQIDDAGEVRRILEVSAIRKAAIRRSEQDLEIVREILKASKDRIDSGDPINLEDEAFHKIIAKSTGNLLLLRVVNWFYEFSRTKRAQYFLDIEQSKISHDEHQKIYNALLLGDPDECAQLMESHLSRSSRVLEEVIRTGETSD